MSDRKPQTGSILRLVGISLVVGSAALVGARGLMVSAGGGKDGSPVKVTVMSTQPDADGRQIVTITLNIKKGWHVFANPVQYPDLEGSRTTVKVTCTNKLQDVKIDYPVGNRQVDGEDSYYTYEDKVEIKATLKRSAGDTEPLDVTIRFHAQTKAMSLPPQLVKLQVK
jgi:DsbC/DsbD-like thiol-disulfide interchange protein